MLLVRSLMRRSSIVSWSALARRRGRGGDVEDAAKEQQADFNKKEEPDLEIRRSSRSTEAILLGVCVKRLPRRLPGLRRR